MYMPPKTVLIAARLVFAWLAVCALPAAILIAIVCSGCGGGIATRSAGNINIQAKAGNDIVIRLAGNDATQAAEKTQSIAAQAKGTVDRTAIGGEGAAVAATSKPAKFPVPLPAPAADPPVTNEPDPAPTPITPPAEEPAQ